MQLLPVVSAHEIIQTNEEIMPYLVDELGQDHILLKIGLCESKLKHFDSNGVLKGKINPDDVGLFQINQFYHRKAAEKNNIDIDTVEGNTAYALKLFNEEGTKPWNSSKQCWSK